MKLKDDERQPCEMWTRVMGYHRPISEFNKGKKAEHDDRQMFVESTIKPAKNNLQNKKEHKK